MASVDYHVDGWVDLVDQNRIQGWVICKRLPATRARISVTLKGQEVVSGIANISRSDLISVGLGMDDFSFSLRFEVALNQSDLADLRVYASFDVVGTEIVQAEVLFLPHVANALIQLKNSSRNQTSKFIKTVYYIAGPTSSGKTTAAIRLAREMNLPVFNADLVYDMLKDKYHTLGEAESLTAFELWSDPRNFGIKSWGEYESIDEAKVELYEALLCDATEDFIIEGFTLSLSTEREIVKKVVGKHRQVILRIDLSYGEWLRLYTKRSNREANGSYHREYEKLRSCFSGAGAFKVAEFDHPDKINAGTVRNIPVLLNSDPLEFISHDDFIGLGRQHLENNPLDKYGNYVGYWKDLDDRWAYHKRVIEIIQQSGKSSSSALELGSMGISVVKNGHTMDYDKHIGYYPELQPHYIHDARNLPWPIPNKYYDWFIALRVFHHLAPFQKQCFHEARRIAKNVILVVPNELPPGGGVPNSPEVFVEWGDGIPPTAVEDVGRFGMLYAWLDI